MIPDTRRIPPTRLFTVDTCSIAKNKHHIGALLELDVTEGRRRLRRLRAAGGEAGTFLGWVLKCLSQAIQEYPEVCALYVPKRRILLFPTVDLNVAVERELQGQRVPLPVVIRDAGGKSIGQISGELRRAQEQPVSEQIVLGAGHARRSERLYGLFPAWLRRLVLRRILLRPKSYRTRMGTVSVTSVGMFGKVNGWFLPLGITPLVVGLGAGGDTRGVGQPVSPLLETARLRLRPLRPSDQSFLVGLWTDPEVTRYMGGPRDPEELASSIRKAALDPEAEKFDLWPVEERQSGRLAGHCGLVEKEVEGRGEVELVYLIAAPDWGRGYATEIASALRDRAFGPLGLERLIALIHPENLASEKVALRVGLRLQREIIRPGGNRRKLYALERPPRK